MLARTSVSTTAAPSGSLPPGGYALRRLLPADRMAVADHLLALCPDDRRARFLWGAGDDALRGHAARLDLAGTAVVGIFAKPAAGHASGPALAALAEVVPAAPTDAAEAGFASAVELAVSVERGHRRRGLGTAVAVAALRLAFADPGVGGAVVAFHPQNRGAVALLRRTGGGLLPALGRARLPPQDFFAKARCGA